MLSNLFAVKSELCGKKFEIKINDIRFVGHPLLVYHQHGVAKSGPNQESILSFNVVFALKVIYFLIFNPKEFFIYFHPNTDLFCLNIRVFV